MKKSLLFLLLTFFTAAFSQIRFEKGYIINNKDEKSEVLIKNEDWSLNPTNFIYKNSEDGSELTAKIENVKEFGVYNFSKYVRFTGPIDQSRDDLQDLGSEKNPKWLEQTVFLQQLAEGKRSLYSYNNSKILRFFYEDGDTKITQLIYKRYLGENSSNIYINNEFRSQLANSFAGDVDGDKFDNLPYKAQSLTNLFKKYNLSDSVLKSDSEKSSFNLYIKPGISFNSAKFQISGGSDLDTDFESKLSPRVGVQLEFILPTRRNKWSVFVEPTYQTYKQESKNVGLSPAMIEYSSIELPIGVRYYMFLNKDAKLFLEGFVNVADFQIGENYITYQIPGTSAEKTYELQSQVTVGGGIGFSYKNKYSVSARYSAKDLVIKYVFFKIPYNIFSISSLYNIF